MKRLIALVLVLVLTVSALSSCILLNFSEIINAIGDPTPGYFTHEDFSEQEKALFIKHIGEVIPFAPTDYYDFGSYYGDGDYDEGIRFSTFDNTKRDFEKYREKFSDYTLKGSEPDEYGDIWYTYQKGYIVVLLSFYRYNGNNIIDVYCYVDENELVASGVLTNQNCGLPEGINGVHKVDFTKADYITNVTGQDDYLNGCPTTGSPKVLVIPVDFSDARAESKGYTIENIKRAFLGGEGETDYHSVDEYYKQSSYGQLDLDITVIDEWFRPKESSFYYKNQKMDYYGEEVVIGDQMVIREALTYLDTIMDLSEFDSDNNGVIDAVVIVNTVNINDSHNFLWAYRYWNIYEHNVMGPYKYDGVTVNDYMWVPYGFLHEGEDMWGDITYTDTSVMNTFTFIHEFGHILGAEDYYNYSPNHMSPLDGKDVMDSTLGDHNPFTKFNYGWVTESRLVTTDSSITLSLKSFTETGDTIILANNWDDRLGAYQEYYIVTYYTDTGLNGDGGGYFDENCIVVYHVNASLYYETYGRTTYYDLQFNNTASSYEGGTADNLIEFAAKKAREIFHYTEGQSLTVPRDDFDEPLKYTFTVDSLTEDEAILTFTRQ